MPTVLARKVMVRCSHTFDQLVYFYDLQYVLHLLYNIEHIYQSFKFLIKRTRNTHLLSGLKGTIMLS